MSKKLDDSQIEEALKRGSGKEIPSVISIAKKRDAEEDAESLEAEVIPKKKHKKQKKH